MLRRWIIRTLFMLPILLLTAGWLWGAMNYISCSYTKAGIFVYFNFSEGRILLAAGRDDNMYAGWKSSTERLGQLKIWPESNDYYKYHWGFAFGPPTAETGGRWYGLSLPYWFLITLSIVALLYVFRKTRRVSTAAFPVLLDAPKS